MRQAIILLESGKVVLTETKVHVFTLEMTDAKGNWLASKDGIFYSNNPDGILASLREDAKNCNAAKACLLANGYLAMITKVGIVKV